MLAQILSFVLSFAILVTMITAIRTSSLTKAAMAGLGSFVFGTGAATISIFAYVLYITP